MNENQNEMTSLNAIENQFKGALLDNQAPWHPLSAGELEWIFTLARQGVQFQGERRDGKWMDQFGACRVCDGEIPHGHAENCDLYKLEQKVFALTAELEALQKDKERLDYIEAGLFQMFPERQFHKLERGPRLDEITLTMYNGRTTFGAIERNLRTAIDSAMEKEAK